MLATLCLIQPFVAMIDQCGDIGHNLKDNGTAKSAVAAIRASLGDILLPAKTDTTITAMSTLDFKNNFIDKIHTLPSDKK